MKIIDLDKLSFSEQWDLMGALRGPDNGSFYAKTIFSIPVRIALFGRYVAKEFSFPNTIPVVNERGVNNGVSNWYDLLAHCLGGDHFTTHGVAALRVVLKYADQTELTAEELSTIREVVKGF